MIIMLFNLFKKKKEEPKEDGVKADGIKRTD